MGEIHLNNLFWDGEMDYGWEDLSKYLKDSCQNFTDIMLNTTEFSPNSESKDLITSECMERFKSIVDILSDIIADAYYYTCEDMENRHINGLKLNAWILLGSLTETTLQMFIAFYIDDYKNTKWQQWEQFEIDQVQRPIIECIQKLVDEGNLYLSQAKSLKKAIKETIKEHTKEHPVQKIMLDELIQLYSTLELMDEDELSYLRLIQSNRNGVHSFQSRETGTWNDLQFSVRFFCYLLDWVINHLPDIPDYEEYY